MLRLSIAGACVALAAFFSLNSSAQAGEYATAFAESTDSGQPLVVLVGADWCPACVTMKTSVMPELKRRGGLAKVKYAQVNTDHESQLAGKLMSGGSVPQLIIYTKGEKGWRRRQITGATSVAAVQQFIDREVAASEAAKAVAASAEESVTKPTSLETGK